MSKLGAFAFACLLALTGCGEEEAKEARETSTNSAIQNSTSQEATVAVADPENAIVIELKDGNVVIELMPEKAPKHVERIKKLARDGFYDGILFHRVIDGFMAQTGDPDGNGTGGSNLPDLPAEFNDGSFTRGTLGMARSSNPNSANSQFFITFGATPHLNGQYTIFGQVVEGMDHVDAIAKGEPPANPDKMLSMKVVADTQ